MASSNRIDLSSKLRLFCSVDIIGSTAYKSDALLRNGALDWYKIIQHFYSEFREVLDKEQCNADGTSRLEFWKSAGDELLFTSLLKNHNEAEKHVAYFRQTMQVYGRRLSEFDPKLKLKATAWLAGFPVNNAVILNDQNQHPEYVGPYMDVGFRLSHLSSDRRFVVSVDLALLLAHGKDRINLYYHGKHELKGVLGGRLYPVFYLDLKEQDIEELEDLWLKRVFCKHVELQKFCDNFIGETGGHLDRPYIKDDLIFNTVPLRHQQTLERWKEAEVNNLEKETDEDVEIQIDSTAQGTSIPRANIGDVYGKPNTDQSSIP